MTVKILDVANFTANMLAGYMAPSKIARCVPLTVGNIDLVARLITKSTDCFHLRIAQIGNAMSHAAVTTGIAYCGLIAGDLIKSGLKINAYRSSDDLLLAAFITSVCFAVLTPLGRYLANKNNPG